MNGYWDLSFLVLRVSKHLAGNLVRQLGEPEQAPQPADSRYPIRHFRDKAGCSPYTNSP